METVVKKINAEKYPVYKNSGIQWLGKIPEHWKIESFRNILKERNEKNHPIRTKEILSLSIGKGVTLYAEKTTNLDRFKDDFSQYKLAYKGDLVLNRMNMIVGAVGVSDYFGCVSPVYYTYYGGLDNSFTSKFYEYLFRCKTVQGVLYSLGKGLIAIDRGDGKYNTLRLKVSRDDLRSLRLPFPNQLEVTAIVNFLDRKTALIDQAIDIKQKQIELLKERRQILIHKAVTRGLNPNLKMKDSGVEWIGEIPEGWEVKKVKHFGVIRSGESVVNSLLNDSGQFEVYGGNGTMGFYNKFNVEGIKIIIGRVGAYCGNVRLIDEKKWISDNALILTLNDENIYSYLAILLEVGNLNNLNSSNAQPLITGTKVLNFQLPIPLKNERQEIQIFIKNAKTKIAKAISLKEQEIEKLKEYKATLINSAVTGKIKVS